MKTKIEVQFQERNIDVKDTEKLVKEFEEKFGPINETPQNTSRWAWISDPWPWEKEGN